MFSNADMCGASINHVLEICHDENDLYCEWSPMRIEMKSPMLKKCDVNHKSLFTNARLITKLYCWEYSQLCFRDNFPWYYSWKFNFLHEFKNENAAHMWMAFKLQLFHVAIPAREIFTDFLTNFPETFWAKFPCHF